MKYTITEQCDGMLIREFLYSERHFTRCMVIRLKKLDDGIMLNGEKVTVRAVLHTGDILILSEEDTDGEVNENIVPSETPIAVVYEDDDILVVDKDDNMPTHPSHGHFDDTLANAVVGYYKRKGEAFVFRPVNRLDRETSGVVLIAKNKFSAAVLSEQLKNGEIEKKYIAVLYGDIKKSIGEKESISLPIGRTADSIITREVKANGDGREALTEYTVIGKFSSEFADEITRKYTVVCASPITGRTHQLRVHFSYIGFPIVGDTLYGNGENCRTGVKRLALHAYFVAFNHPRSGERITVTAPCKFLKEGINLNEEVGKEKIQISRY